jgi:hypothetical protein
MSTLHTDDYHFTHNINTNLLSATASKIDLGEYTDEVEMCVKFDKDDKRIPGGETVRCHNREDVSDSMGFLIAVIYWPAPNDHFTKLIIYND